MSAPAAKLVLRDPRLRKYTRPLTRAHYQKMVARHEIAHVVMEAICGFPIKFVRLNGLGGYAQSGPVQVPRISDVLITLAGCAAEYHRSSWWRLAIDKMHTAAVDCADGKPMNAKNDFSRAAFLLNGDEMKLERYYDEAQAIITAPEVWSVVQKLTRMLLKRKRLDWEDVQPHVASIFNTHMARRRAARCLLGY